MNEFLPQARFATGEFNVNFIPRDDSFIVPAADLARGLGYSGAKDLLRSVPGDEQGWTTVVTAGGPQQLRYLTEPGLYRIVGQRHAARIKDPHLRDAVERFQRWIFHVVLPALRRQGRYSMYDSLPSTFTWEHATRVAQAHHGMDMSMRVFRRMLKLGSILRENGTPRARYQHLFWPCETRFEVHASALPFLATRAMETARELGEQAVQAQLPPDPEPPCALPARTRR